MDSLPTLQGAARALAVALVSRQQFVFLVDYLLREERAQEAFTLARRFALDSSITVHRFCPCGDRPADHCFCPHQSIYERLWTLVPQGALWAKVDRLERLPANLEERIAAARAGNLATEVHVDARGLLAKFQASCSPDEFRQTLTAATALAQIDGEKTISAAHVSEARGYQSAAFAAKVYRREFLGD